MIIPCKAAVFKKHQEEEQNRKRIKGDEEIVVNPPGKRRSKHNTEYFPKHLVDDMLLNLPVKSLLRLRCLSKDYNSAICSNSFIRNHLHYNRNNLSRSSLIFQKSSATIAMLHYDSIHRLEDSHQDEKRIMKLSSKDLIFPFDVLAYPFSALYFVKSLKKSIKIKLEKN